MKPLVGLLLVMWLVVSVHLADDEEKEKDKIEKTKDNNASPEEEDVEKKSGKPCKGTLANIVLEIHNGRMVVHRAGTSTEDTEPEDMCSHCPRMELRNLPVGTQLLIGKKRRIEPDEGIEVGPLPQEGHAMWTPNPMVLRLDRRIHELEAQLRDVRNRNMELEEAENNLRISQTRVGELEEIKETLTNMAGNLIDEEGQELRDMRRQLDHAQHALADVSEDYDFVSAELERVKAQLAKITDECEEWKRDCVKFAEEMSELDNENDALRNCMIQTEDVLESALAGECMEQEGVHEDEQEKPVSKNQKRWQEMNVDERQKRAKRIREDLRKKEDERKGRKESEEIARMLVSPEEFDRNDPMRRRWEDIRSEDTEDGLLRLRNDHFMVMSEEEILGCTSRPAKLSKVEATARYMENYNRRLRKEEAEQKRLEEEREQRELREMEEELEALDKMAQCVIDEDKSGKRDDDKNDKDDKEDVK